MCPGRALVSSSGTLRYLSYLFVNLSHVQGKQSLIIFVFFLKHFSAVLRIQLLNWLALRLLVYRRHFNRFDCRLNQLLCRGSIFHWWLRLLDRRGRFGSLLWRRMRLLRRARFFLRWRIFLWQRILVFSLFDLSYLDLRLLSFFFTFLRVSLLRCWWGIIAPWRRSLFVEYF